MVVKQGPAPSLKRVCIVGAESTGTTTLARELAEHYKTAWVPEYGREYSEKLAAAGIDLWRYRWKSEEFVHIAHVQHQWEDEMAPKSNRILFCDTDAMATAIWHERYCGARSAEVEAIAHERTYDLYILTGSEIPFVQDGIRDGERIRQWMTSRFEEELSRESTPWLKVSGTPEQRLLRATQAVDHLLTSHQPTSSE
jgi:NadR type nicotinamide-nucleotide adenylyltransferase